MDNLDPDFKTPIQIDYVFEAQQDLRIKVYDWDSDNSRDFLG
jgi:hypothetical protein